MKTPADDSLHRLPSPSPKTHKRKLWGWFS